MRDPYDVLEVPRGASDDDIKKAYRTLSRKYHPDANINNPDKAGAEEKFKEVQQAYKQIQDEKSGKYGYYGSGRGAGGPFGGFGPFGSQGTGGPFGGFGPFGSQGAGGPFGGQGAARQEDENDLHMKAAANYIGSGHFREALNVLESIPESARTAQWYFFSAAANSGSGNNVTARQMADRAVMMEPGNAQYRQLKEQLDGGGAWYQGMGNSYGMPMGPEADLCSSACMTSVLYSMCGPGVFCCI